MKIVGVKFGDNGKICYFNSNNLDLKLNLTVIVDTDKGLKFGKIVDLVENNKNNDVYHKVIRIASKKDFQQNLKNIQDEEKAFEKCKELVVKNKLNMTIIDASYNFDKTQLVFRFLADERIDFRKLAKDLGAILKTRIELRQIGVRDKAKDIGGIGPCGRLLCCSSFLTDFDTISINMAKNQGLALNPTKINGVCGRLLCCLNYENEQYIEAKKNIPDVGKKIKMGSSEGKVISSDPLAGKYKVLLDNDIVEVNINDSKE